MSWKGTGKFACMAIVDEDGQPASCGKDAVGFHSPPPDSAPWMLKMAKANGKGVPACQKHLDLLKSSN